MAATRRRGGDFVPQPSLRRIFSLLAIGAVICVAAAVDGPARVSCDAGYSLPCSRTNSKWLANITATELYERGQVTQTVLDLFAHVNGKLKNKETGFYPFVYDATTSVCVAHGARPDFVGKTLATIMTELNLGGYSSATAVHQRFAAASLGSGGWVQYLWSAGPGQTPTSKMAYVIRFTDAFPNAQYYVGVGYEDRQMPPDLPCSDQTDEWCSINNVRSLVGKAQTQIAKADTLANFEESLLEMSYDSAAFQIPAGFYLFTYSYGGPLRSHAKLHNYFGQSLTQILTALGRTENGTQMHADFVDAAEGRGNGWVRYLWKNSADEPAYTKIAYIVKVEFGQQSYYVGAGFNYVKGDPMPGPLNAPCPASTNLPCSLKITLQLSSHAQAHVISSPASVAAMFDEFNSPVTGPNFKSGSFYAFFYDYNSTCVAHGAAPRFVGMTLPEVFLNVSIPLNASALHQKFTESAEAGGGWVQYDWTNPTVPGSSFQKISYIFKFMRAGREYYGGVGLNHQVK
jgi:signal transduction histidine kinase